MSERNLGWLLVWMLVGLCVPLFAPARALAQEAPEWVTHEVRAPGVSYHTFESPSAGGRVMASSSIRPFDSGAITMAFIPSSATMTEANPAIRSSVITHRVSMPAASSSRTMKFPSIEVRPSMRTRAPHRAAATAWFAPLPPG